MRARVINVVFPCPPKESKQATDDVDEHSWESSLMTLDVNQPAPPGAALQRQLGLDVATALVVGEVIGVGIFLTPAKMAHSLGSPFLLLVVWLIMGAVAIAGALCFGALAARFPEAGGSYAYLRHLYGRRPAFLYGWLSLLVTDPGITAAVAVGMTGYAGSLFGLSSLGRKVFAVGAILAMAAVNIVGVRLGAGLVRGLTLVKIGALVSLAVLGFGLGLGDWSNFVPLVARRPGSDPLPPALIGALIAAFFSFGGWWDTSKIAGEVRDPGRTMPRALVLGVSIVTIAYILTSAVFLYLVPLSLFKSDRGFAALAGEALFGRAGGIAFSMIVIVMVLGSLAGLLMAAPRVYYAMARDGLFPRALATINPRTGTPARATAIQAGLASLLAASGTFEQILDYFMFPTVAFLALTAAGVYFAGAVPAGNPGARVPGHPITPLIFLVPTALLMVLLVVGNHLGALLGAGVVLLGIPVYHLVFARSPAPTVEVSSPSTPS
jgi:basic amino acid/polyamine antiporter, APA family